MRSPAVVALVLVSAIVAAACGSARPQPAGPTTGVRVESSAHAVAIATSAGRDAGYDPAEYQLVSAELEPDGLWWIAFDHVPPGRPGAHFAVHVDARTGAARLVPGR